ncbi:MAG: M20/M25/M40 family metallo-hydrolase [Burkholderiaceae bacterium]|jgi:acetylornithine deacetylase/succinyl-diaminopimelate desuccinylase-like protein|nr:M20/M25/M40 family metallo-hydrolase [Burkholderiaceae bacterium]MEB2319088.1 M20/M25/M40 family metallo-hydrolase [Pseudomonadota bacterium]
MDHSELRRFIEARWRDELTERLVEYVRVPAKSPAFDSSWRAHGHLESVVRSGLAWGRAQAIAGLRIEIVAIDDRTPCLFFDVPATGGRDGSRSVLFYGHLDKQPEMEGWREGFGPWLPRIENGRLYGRGSADDGYALYAALTIIAAIDAQGVARPRCVGLIETSEESGSPDLPAYLEMLAPRLGDVALVAGLDSGAGNYEQLWVTTSLRGLAGGLLSVEILDEGVHSGAASGIVPSSFRIARQLLNRLDDPDSGRVLVDALHAPIPGERIDQARTAGAILGDMVWRQFPWVGCVHGEGAGAHAMPVTTDPVEAILNRTWRPALSVVGAAGLPLPDQAGNVLRPRTALKLSMRLPPTVDAERAAAAMRSVLEQASPYGARVRFEPDHVASGWNAPPSAPWLVDAVDAASVSCFGRPAGWIGEGGTIPFMNMLGERFPQAQFLITGVLGPQSNAHGPNEFLHLEYATRLTEAVASIVTEVPS